MAKSHRDIPKISLLGTTALLLEVGDSLQLDTQKCIWALAKEIDEWPEIGEAVPGMNNLMIVFNTPPEDIDTLKRRMEKTWQSIEPLELTGRIVELPVIYGGEETGPHMSDVVEHTKLSVQEIAQRHSAPLYPVYALGSHPGFCYLGGMDTSIATPRRKVPLASLPAGAVSIGGMQTAVSASEGPSGWNTIGSTQVDFFDLTKEPPILCEPGDFIRFTIKEVIE